MHGTVKLKCKYVLVDRSITGNVMEVSHIMFGLNYDLAIRIHDIKLRDIV